MTQSTLKSFAFGLFGLVVASCAADDDITGSYVFEQNPRATLSIGGGTITAGGKGAPASISAAYKIESKEETPASEGHPKRLTFRVSLSVPDERPAEVVMTLTQNVLVVENDFSAFGGRWVKQ